MTADELLSELAARGVVLTANGDRLRVEAPAGAIGADLRQALAEHKPAILARLMDAGERLEPAEALEVVRIPLGWGRWTKKHGGDDICDWLVAHGLRVVGGTAHGPNGPLLFLAPMAAPADVEV